MPRGRILDKEAISHSRRLHLLSNDTGRLIYTWLLAHLDREGRFSADPSIIKGNIFPRIKSMTYKKIENCLLEMAQVKLIMIYQSDGDKYLQFIKFKEYQTHLDREAPSKIPAPDKENIINSGLNPTKSDQVPLIQYNTIQLNTTKANKGINKNKPVENSLTPKEKYNYRKGMDKERENERLKKELKEEREKEIKKPFEYYEALKCAKSKNYICSVGKKIKMCDICKKEILKNIGE
jgi:hypothetical protein